jgi:hypothetical protein
VGLVRFVPEGEAVTPWNAHQKLGAAIKRLQHFERRVRATRRRRTPQERRANSLARTAMARAFFDVQDAWRRV